jgi:hypothetical protein
VYTEILFNFVKELCWLDRTLFASLASLLVIFRQVDLLGIGLLLGSMTAGDSVRYLLHFLFHKYLFAMLPVSLFLS